MVNNNKSLFGEGDNMQRTTSFADATPVHLKQKKGRGLRIPGDQEHHY